MAGHPYLRDGKLVPDNFARLREWRIRVPLEISFLEGLRDMSFESHMDTLWDTPDFRLLRSHLWLLHRQGANTGQKVILKREFILEGEIPGLIWERLSWTNFKNVLEEHLPNIPMGDITSDASATDWLLGDGSNALVPVMTIMTTRIRSCAPPVWADISAVNGAENIVIAATLSFDVCPESAEMINDQIAAPSNIKALLLEHNREAYDAAFAYEPEAIDLAGLHRSENAEPFLVYMHTRPLPAETLRHALFSQA